MSGRPIGGEDWSINGQLIEGVEQGVIYHGPNGDREEIIKSFPYTVVPLEGETSVSPFVRAR